MSLNKIALFGANGQIGSSIMRALLECDKQKFEVLAIVPPDSSETFGAKESNVKVKEMDLLNASREDVAKALEGVDAVVSALNGKALEAQATIQDAAADSSVKRFYPSEYGMHNIYRKPNDPMGYIHPMWDQKNKANEYAVLHPAINAGKMSYTVIGCGDFYNQDRETVWCPWTQTQSEEFTLHVIGDADAKADYTHTDDFGRYLVASLCEPEKSENKYLNFPSDHISHREIADLLHKHSGKPVHMDVIPMEKMHEVVDDPSKAPKELQSESPFPVDFWFLVKSAQGSGKFFRPRGQNHNDLFPDVERTTFEKYLSERYQGKSTAE